MARLLLAVTLVLLAVVPTLAAHRRRLLSYDDDLDLPLPTGINLSEWNERSDALMRRISDTFVTERLFTEPSSMSVVVIANSSTDDELAHTSKQAQRLLDAVIALLRCHLDQAAEQPKTKTTSFSVTGASNQPVVSEWSGYRVIVHPPVYRYTRYLADTLRLGSILAPLFGGNSTTEDCSDRV